MRKTTKKMGILLFVFLVGCHGLFAYDNFIGASSHWGLAHGDFGVEYERNLDDKWSILVEAGFNTVLFIPDGIRLMAGARFYPWSEKFFISAKIGYEPIVIVQAIGINPMIGWRFDVGAEDGFVLFFDLGADLQIMFGDHFTYTTLPVIPSGKIGLKFGYSW